MTSKLEWEAIKKQHKNRCKICGITEKKAGILEKAHLKARSKGGSLIIPLCRNCHYKYDNGKLAKTELKKLGIDEQKYKHMRPKRSNKREDFWF